MRGIELQQANILQCLAGLRRQVLDACLLLVKLCTLLSSLLLERGTNRLLYLVRLALGDLVLFDPVGNKCLPPGLANYVDGS